jgi:D-alanine-D-alanine ligase
MTNAEGSAMKITVLLGGPSAEREISLISGAAVAQALRDVGHDVSESDISPDDLSGLDHPADVIFPVLHGAFGESGDLQEILEQRDLPFVGSGSRASRIGINKVATKRLWEAAGLPTPSYQLVTRFTPAPARMAAPCVVKPIESGSSIDVIICRTQAQADGAYGQLLEKYDEVMAEELIEGMELTIGLLEEEPLDPIRIVVKREFFDYDAKYNGCGTEHHFDLDLPNEVVDQCRQLARKANRVVGARDLARVDLMLDQNHQPYLLEINTLPGFTSTSLLPEAAAHAGIEFGPLVDRLASRAQMRGMVRSVPVVKLGPALAKKMLKQKIA